MFGTFRHILALLVVIHHLPAADPVGWYAVFAFFLLSGYLMTLVTNETYRGSKNGLYRYLLNRALRIYPAYWVMLALGLGLAFSLPAVSREVVATIVFPESTGNLLAQISIFGIALHCPPIIIPAAWSLEVEFFYYLAIPLLASTRRSALLWFGLSVIGTAVALALQVPWEDRYFSVFAASLPFSMGSVIYHYREALLPLIRSPGLHVALAGCLFIGNVAAALLDLWGGFAGTFGFYLSLLFAAYAMLALIAAGPQVSKRWQRLDRVLGDLSYPIFLSHINAGILVAALSGTQTHSWAFFCLSLPAVYLLSAALHLTVEQFVKPLRSRVRPSRSDAIEERLVSARL